MMSLSEGATSEDNKSIMYRLNTRVNEQGGALSVSYRDSLIMHNRFY